MKLRFTNHAKYRLFIERGIATADVKSVIKKPDSQKHIRNNLIKASKKLDKGALVVVYSKEGRNEFVIITAYFK